jgi:hypothetical protein
MVSYLFITYLLVDYSSNTRVRARSYKNIKQ